MSIKSWWKKSESGIKNFLGGERPGEAGFIAIPETKEQAQARSEGLQSQIEARNMLSNQASPEQQAAIEGQSQMAGEAGKLGDVRRRVQALMAQRGIQNTSMGMGAQIGAEREMQDRMQQIQASLPERIRQIREQRALQLAQIGQGMTGSAGQYQVSSNARQGGSLEGLLSAGAKIGASYAGAPA